MTTDVSLARLLRAARAPAFAPSWSTTPAFRSTRARSPRRRSPTPKAHSRRWWWPTTSTTTPSARARWARSSPRRPPRRQARRRAGGRRALGQPVPRRPPARRRRGCHRHRRRGNRRILKLIGARELDELQRQLPDYIAHAKVDMGFKHFAFALGAPRRPARRGRGPTAHSTAAARRSCASCDSPENRMRQYRNYVAGGWVEPAALPRHRPGRRAHRRRGPRGRPRDGRRRRGWWTRCGARRLGPHAGGRARCDALPHRRRDRAPLRGLQGRDRRHGQAAFTRLDAGHPSGAANFRIFADILEDRPARKLSADLPGGAHALNYTVRKPLGVVGVISPWNLPLLLLTWKVAPVHWPAATR